VRIDIVSIFPDYLKPLELSLVGKARETGLLDIRIHDLRHWSTNKHHRVDDTPYGGGPGMVMMAEPWGAALDDIHAERERESPGYRPLLVIPTPSGDRFTHATAREWSCGPDVVFACGRYEGIDARVAQFYSSAPQWAGVAEVSIGDYVLAGGEAAALVMVEAVARLIPGVLGNDESAARDSFATDPHLVEGPTYTKPPTWRGWEVPSVLLSGHHGQIATWQEEQSLQRTRSRRPDLMGEEPDTQPQV